MSCDIFLYNLTIIRSLSMIVFSLCAMVKTVKSENFVLIVCWINSSVLKRNA